MSELLYKLSVDYIEICALLLYNYNNKIYKE